MSHIFTGYNGYGYDQVLSTEQKYMCQYLKNIRKQQNGFTITMAIDLIDAPVGTADAIQRYVEFMLRMQPHSIKLNAHNEFSAVALHYTKYYREKYKIRYKIH